MPAAAITSSTMGYGSTAPELPLRATVPGGLTKQWNLFDEVWRVCVLKLGAWGGRLTNQLNFFDGVWRVCILKLGARGVTSKPVPRLGSGGGRCEKLLLSGGCRVPDSSWPPVPAGPV